MKKNEQIIEVEYDKEMVQDDIKAQEENNEELILQDELNADEVEEMLGEGAEIIEE